jgi:hypothetical protein
MTFKFNNVCHETFAHKPEIYSEHIACVNDDNLHKPQYQVLQKVSSVVYSIRCCVTIVQNDVIHTCILYLDNKSLAKRNKRKKKKSKKSEST